MKGRKFFRLVWNVNALIIFGAGSALILVLFAVLFLSFRDVTGTHHRSNIVNIGTNNTVTETWSLSSLSEIDGSPYLVAARRSEQSYRQDYYGKETTSVRNYLFINTSTADSHWLVPHDRFLFLSQYRIHKKDDQKTVTGFLYTFVTTDSDSNARLTATDKKTIAFSAPSGKGFYEIIGNIEEYSDFHAIDDERILLIFKKDGRYFMGEFNIRLKKMLLQKELPPV